ncbi:MAG: response regulator [Vicinamibacterales bacterium]
MDDNPDTLDMYALGLRHEGFEVATAPSAEVALQAVRNERPDCIVADIRLPGMTGLDFRRSLSRSAATSDIPVIALTGNSARAEIEDAQAAGFEEVIVKPCLPEALARQIRVVLQRSRKARSEG